MQSNRRNASSTSNTGITSTPFPPLAPQTYRKKQSSASTSRPTTSSLTSWRNSPLSRLCNSGGCSDDSPWHQLGDVSEGA
ncbi:hypothetical protein NEOLEDRAFT_615926 [Neolentinus lepideus HHB14362 ss-1]|uniref:Uncharacterized protein n=1 Tax=Neolentinus lepideus HHB14362 ss-1 TaxID=1314782 RepID=A0A165QVE5_9AGAM|nr:hypothetical protein NEOLEDRAFT_615926 [Neolentinus lepideus HHB14362 ss-1]